MLTVASGVYYTGAACSINENAEQQLYYTSGADLVLQERWEATSTTVQNELGMDTNETYVGYIEPDISKYVALAEDTPEIVSMAKVYNETGDTAKCKLTTEVKNVQIMGIQTKEFGETCNMDSSLLPTHLNNYLNAMSVNPRSVLVSTNFHDVYGVEIGESISYTTSTGGKLTGIVTGFVDYFPTYSPTIQVNGESVDQFLVVASFSQLYSLYDQNNGIPYQIWYKLSGSSQFIYDFAEENGISYAVFSDYHANQISMKNEPLLQGTNGVLTIGFIVTLLLCAVGFLMYWILSIRARQLQFGIYRAMGMSTGGMMSMLLCEQICVSGVSILAGVAIGLIASKLYVPLIQMAYTASEQVLPLEVITSAADLWKLFAVIAVTMIICLTVITVMIRKLKISQALKLGED
jgi:putative ABC transport system permease protein